MVGAGAFLRWASFGSGIRKKRHPFNGAFSRRGQTAACRYNDPGNGRPAHQLWYTGRGSRFKPDTPRKAYVWYTRRPEKHQKTRDTPEKRLNTELGLEFDTAWIQRLMSDTPIYLQLDQLWHNWCRCSWLNLRFSLSVTLCKHSQYRYLVYFFICIFSIFSFWYLWWLEQCEVGCECIAGWGPSSQVRPFHASGGAEWMVCAKIVTSIAQHKWGLVCQTCQTCPPRVCTAPSSYHPLTTIRAACTAQWTSPSFAPKVLDSSKFKEIPHTAQRTRCIWPTKDNLCCRP